MSPEQIAQAQQMRRNEMPWAHIAKHFGVTPDTVRRALDPEWAARRRAGVAEARRRRGEGTKARSFNHVPDMRVSDKADGERLLREVPADTRDLTGRICGDPLPGRAALDRMRSRENAR